MRAFNDLPSATVDLIYSQEKWSQMQVFDNFENPKSLNTI